MLKIILLIMKRGFCNIDLLAVFGVIATERDVLQLEEMTALITLKVDKKKQFFFNM